MLSFCDIFAANLEQKRLENFLSRLAHACVKLKINAQK